MVADVVTGAVLIGVGVVLGYVAAVRVARRQRHHEMKEQAYQDLLGTARFTIDTLTMLRQVTDPGLKLDENDPNLAGALTRLLMPLFTIGDRDTFFDVAEFLEGDEDDEDRQEEQVEEVSSGDQGQPRLEHVRDLVKVALTFELAHRRRELAIHQSSALFPRNPSVEAALKDLLDTITADEMTWGFGSLLRLVGLEGVVPPMDPQQRLQLYQQKLAALEKSISDDLRRTL